MTAPIHICRNGADRVRAAELLTAIADRPHDNVPAKPDRPPRLLRKTAGRIPPSETS